MSETVTKPVQLSIQLLPAPFWISALFVTGSLSIVYRRHQQIKDSLIFTTLRSIVMPASAGIGLSALLSLVDLSTKKIVWNTETANQIFAQQSRFASSLVAYKLGFDVLQSYFFNRDQ
eukprot:TRINITY_DN12057_c0_g1_i1.p2 TRINITY_DN12057_c0_g1~~TRINITY_DN12057_c0_g1_i1.p2  ORF type:complete len:118 (-),score=21.11 TRINITY_DN12057_c0_g1_i1:27-380(-)